MKKIIILCLTLSAFSMLNAGKAVDGAPGKKNIYYFYAEYCEACKRAQDHFRKPEKIKDGASWTYEDINFIPYRIVDESNKPVRKNISRLIEMCESIRKKTGKSEFVYYDRDTYEYYAKDGIPYYRKQGRYAKKNDPFPTPVFIIGNRVILGFNLNLINSSLALL